MYNISPLHRCTISSSQGEIANVISVHFKFSPSQGDIVSVTSERRISSRNGFNELTIQSTINGSEEDEAESDPNSNPKVSQYTTNRNSPHKLFINLTIPKIIPGAIRLIDQTITKHVVGIRETLDARQNMLSKEIVTDTTCSGARILWTPQEVIRTGRDGTMPRDVNTTVEAARLTPPVQIFHSTSDSPTLTGTQDILNPIDPLSPQWSSNADKLKNSMNAFLQKTEVPDPVSVR